MGSTVLAILVLTVALIVGYASGWVSRGRKLGLPLLRTDDLLLQEAEAEVEALLSGGSPDQLAVKRPKPLPPPDRELVSRPRHPRLTEIQRRAIVGLLRDGLSAVLIRWLIVDGIEPPHGKERATWNTWSGRYCLESGTPVDRVIEGEDPGEWTGPVPMSNETWAYVRRVIETLPRPDYSWLFQYRNGKRISHADVLLCSSDDVE